MGQRPPHVTPPAYLAKNPPVPAPAATQDLGTAATPAPDDDPLGRNPVRYGDWELKGIAIDF